MSITGTPFDTIAAEATAEHHTPRTGPPKRPPPINRPKPPVIVATAVVTLARLYIERGIAVIPVPYKEKGPRTPGWQNLQLTADEFAQQVSGRDTNIGILLGTRSGGLIDLDLDCLEAVSLASKFLPPTPFVFGRESKPRSHYMYCVDGPVDPTKFQDSDGSMVLETRSTRQQTVGPGSVHPSGEAVEFVTGNGSVPEPATVDAKQLMQAAGKCAAGALLARHYPASGGRHEFVLALAGALARLGWTVDEVSSFVEAVAAIAGDGDIPDRLRAVADTVAKVEAGNTVTGWSAISTIISEPVCSKVREWLQVSTEPAEPEIPPFIPFPIEEFPEPIASFAREAANALVCDEAAIAVPMLAALASAIGNSRWVRIRRDWFEPCVLWIMLIAITGSKKTPILKMAMQFVLARQKKLHEEYKVQYAQYESDLAKWNSLPKDTRPPEKPEKPVDPHVYVDDTTIEGLGGALEQALRGLLLYRDEISGWFASFNQYKHGGGDEQAYLPFYNGSALKITRKNSERPTIYVPRATVSIVGGIQPRVLGSSFTEDRYANGIAPRFIPVFPPEKNGPGWTDAEVSAETTANVQQIFDGLYGLSLDKGEPVYVHLSDESRELFKEFVNAITIERRTMGDTPLAGAWAKFEALPARIALILQLVDDVAHGAPQPPPVEYVHEQAMQRAIIITRWLMNEAKRVYAMLGHQSAADPQEQLVNLIREKGGRITPAELRSSSRKYRGPGAADIALQALINAGNGSWVTDGPTPAGGRPSTIFVLRE